MRDRGSDEGIEVNIQGGIKWDRGRDRGGIETGYRKEKSTVKRG